MSAGYDAHERAPLGDMCLRSEDYAWMTRQLIHTLGGAETARIALCLEGGYHRHALADVVRATADALASTDEVANPRARGRGLRGCHAAELANVEVVQAFWKLG